MKHSERKCFHELSVDEQIATFLKIATLNCKIKNNCIIVQLKDYHKIVIVKDNSFKMSVVNSPQNFFKYLSSTASASEETVTSNFLNVMLENRDSGSVEIFKNYKKKHYNLARTDSSEWYFKLYFKERPDQIERANLGRKWIDFTKQLETSNIIYDQYDYCGLWAAKKEIISSFFMQSQINRYGSYLMLLRKCADTDYVFTKNEIIGKKFEVCTYGSLFSEDLWENIKSVINVSFIRSVKESTNILHLKENLEKVIKVE